MYENRQERRVWWSRPRRCLCLGLLDRLPDSIPPPLLLHHDAEPPEVIQASPRLQSLPPRCPAGLLPLLHHRLFFELLFYDARAGCTREGGEFQRGEGEMFVGERLARDGGCWAVDYRLKERGEIRPDSMEATGRTRLWSMISAMTAILPALGPALRRTTASR